MKYWLPARKSLSQCPFRPFFLRISEQSPEPKHSVRLFCKGVPVSNRRRSVLKPSHGRGRAPHFQGFTTNHIQKMMMSWCLQSTMGSSYTWYRMNIFCQHHVGYIWSWFTYKHAMWYMSDHCFSMLFSAKPSSSQPLQNGSLSHAW